ncbi:MAG: hypothetical protein ACREO3_04435 [Arenimonas sp.]
MSLTFQLARGGLALAMGFALAATAWLAPAASGSPRVILVSDAAPVVIACPVPPPVLRLALSPADLPASHRANGSCRA